MFSIIPESGCYLVSCVACAIICICLQETASVSGNSFIEHINLKKEEKSTTYIDEH